MSETTLYRLFDQGYQAVRGRELTAHRDPGEWQARMRLIDARAAALAEV